jgi:hypothetical protein
MNGDDSPVCSACGEPAVANDLIAAGVRVWYCLKHLCLHDPVAAALHGRLRRPPKDRGGFR